MRPTNEYDYYLATIKRKRVMNAAFKKRMLESWTRHKHLILSHDRMSDMADDVLKSLPEPNDFEVTWKLVAIFAIMALLAVLGLLIYIV